MTAKPPLLQPDKRRIADAVVLWQLLTLAGLVVVSVFTIWHLKRRGSIVRNRIEPPVIRSGGLNGPSDESAEPGQTQADA
ncbi:MAG: hypothetical protein ACKO85_07120 [Isosphaeraceae bacterium]